MQRPSVYGRRDGQLDVKMTPMIDVVFLLLVFFLWTASFRIVEQILPSRVSDATGTQAPASDEPPPPEEDFDDLVVRVQWREDRPAWRINDQPLGSLEEVRGMLRSVARLRRDAPVIVHPDGNVPLGHVIDLYDAVRLEGFGEVQFAVSESS